MNKVFEITDFSDLELIARWFKARLDWMPFDTDTQSYFPNWLEGVHGDSSKWRNNMYGSLEIIPDNVIYGKQLIFRSVPMNPPLKFGDTLKSYKSACLVGNFNVERGVLTVDVEFSNNLNVVEALWWLSVTRFKGEVDAQSNPIETITPEWDTHETNTPQNIGKLSTSVILDYEPAKYAFVKKTELLKGRQTLVTEIKGNKMITHAPVKHVAYRGTAVPMYPILWTAVGVHQRLLSPAPMIIHGIKLET